MVTLPPSIEEEELKVVASESLICYSSHHSDSVFGVCGPPWFFLFWVFHVNILCPSSSCSVLSISVCAYLSRSLLSRTYTSQPLWPITILTLLGTVLELLGTVGKDGCD